MTAATEATARQIVITRLIDAPRELVFAAFTDRAHVGKWWGPRGFTITTHEHSAKPGGVWRFTMHGPDGTDWANKVVYREVVAPERLVWDHSSDLPEGTPDPHRFVGMVLFAAEGKKTRITFQHTFATAAQRDEIAKFAVAGGNSTLDCLEEHLGLEGTAPAGAFRLTRVLHAPRALVFKVWTEAEHLAKWWGPAGMPIRVAKLELRPGGVFHYAMRLPDGQDAWGRFVFTEVRAPERLGFVTSFSDAAGGITRHPMSASWPLEVESTLTFTELEGRTLLTMTGVPVRASEDERKTFAAGAASMNQGFAGTFAQLERYLTTL